MTWVIGTSSIMGYGVVISDVQVTFSNGKTIDLVQKAYPIGNYIVAGFSGSVKIGFALLQSLSEFMHLPDDKIKTHAWDPVWVANKWSTTAKNIFDSQPDNEKKVGAKILMVGISPNEDLGVAHAKRVYIVRFSAPDFKPGFMNKPLDVCSIGSGAGITEYKLAIKEFTDIKSSTIQMEMIGFGGWSSALSHTLLKVIEGNPVKGISKHLHLHAFTLGKLIATTNDETLLPNDADPIEIKMPQVAKSYTEFIKMASEQHWDAECAIF